MIIIFSLGKLIGLFQMTLYGDMSILIKITILNCRIDMNLFHLSSDEIITNFFASPAGTGLGVASNIEKLSYSFVN